MPISFSSLTYDRAAARYRGSKGRFLSSKEARRVIDADIDIRKSRFDLHASPVAVAANNFQNGTGTRQEYEQAVEAWSKKMGEEIKWLHLAELASAKGGVHNLDQSDYGRAGQLIREQYAYLQKRKEALLANPKYGAGEKFVRDCEAYAEAGRGTYETVKELEDRQAGRVFTYNDPDPLASHCVGPNSCPEQTSKGVVHVDEMVRVGSRICNVWCRCNTPRFTTMDAAKTARAAVGL